MSHGPSPPCCLVLHSCGANNDLYTFQWLKGEYYFVTCKNGLTFKFQCLHKCSFILTWSHPFTHASPVAAFALQRQSWVVAAETKWPIEPKTVLSDPFQQEFACSCFKPFVSFSSFFKKEFNLYCIFSITIQSPYTSLPKITTLLSMSTNPFSFLLNPSIPYPPPTAVIYSPCRSLSLFCVSVQFVH